MKEEQPPLNIWNDITKTWTLRIDLCLERGKTVGIHNTDFVNVVNDLDWLIKSLSIYRDEMAIFYGKETKGNRSYQYTRVYLAFDSSTGYYKIGRSLDPRQREKTLMSEKPTIEYLYISDIVPFSTEKYLHTKFKRQRIRGEWFRLLSSDVEYIKNYINGIA